MAIASDRSVFFLIDLIVSRDDRPLLASFPDTGAGLQWKSVYTQIANEVDRCTAYGKDPHGAPDALKFDLIQSDVSKLIDQLKKCPVAMPTKPEPVIPVEDGIYLTGRTIYKVQTSQRSQRKYAKKLVIEENQPVKGGHVAGKFVFAPGAISKIKGKDKLTYEKAKEFGALYGVCCCCGRLLSNELSVFLGIGPVCGDREFGGEFKILINKAKAGMK